MNLLNRQITVLTMKKYRTVQEYLSMPYLHLQIIPTASIHLCFSLRREGYPPTKSASAAQWMSHKKDSGVMEVRNYRVILKLITVATVASYLLLFSGCGRNPADNATHVFDRSDAVTIFVDAEDNLPMMLS